jgi:hypothetical protein
MQKRMDFASLATASPESSGVALEPAHIVARPAAAPVSGSSIGGWMVAAVVLLVGVVILYLAWNAMQTTKKLSEMEGQNARMQLEISGLHGTLGQMMNSQIHHPEAQRAPKPDPPAEETVVEVPLPSRAILTGCGR